MLEWGVFGMSFGIVIFPDCWDTVMITNFLDIVDKGNMNKK